MGLQRKREMESGVSLHWGQKFRAGVERTSARMEKDVLTDSSRAHDWLRLYSWWNLSRGGSSTQLLWKNEQATPWQWTVTLLLGHRFFMTLPLPWPSLTCSGLASWCEIKKKCFVLSSAVRQGKEKQRSWCVHMPETCICLMWVVDTASAEGHTCSIPEQALGTSSKTVLCPAFAFPTAV